MPFDFSLSSGSPVFDAILQAAPPELPVYLVGGSLRDMLLQREVHDFDFAVPKGALQLGRRLANALGGAFYPLDEARETARVLWTDPAGHRGIIDIALLRGATLEEDLQGRDFTINALALDLRRPDVLIDYLGGLQDLHTKNLRLCSPSSLEDDPVRVLRAIRLAVDLELKLILDTKNRLRQAVPRLAQVTPERMRDELFRMLDGTRPQVALRLLASFNALQTVLPELEALPGEKQPAPHVHDVWEHTLGVVQSLSTILNLLAAEYNPDITGNLAAGLLTVRLGRYRQQIEQHLRTPVSAERSLRSLYFLAALYHDAGKPRTRSVNHQGQIHFYEHEKISAEMVVFRAHALRLSAQEADRLRAIVRHHMRPIWLSNSDAPPTRRAIYRFFRDTGPAGVDICLFSLADVWATYGHTLPQSVWRKHLDVVRTLLDAWWEQNDQLVSPPLLVNGYDLMQALELEPGSQVGRLLNAVREAQAEGKVHTRDEAIAFARIELQSGNFDGSLAPLNGS